MKRFFSLLISVMLFAACTGYAYEDEITFRGLVWGMEFSDFEAQNSESDYPYVVENAPAVSVNELAYGGTTSLEEPSDTVVVRYENFEQVAGYTPVSVELYFANTGSNSTPFYLAQYYFEAENGFEMYETLYKKLYSLYDEVDFEKGNELDDASGVDYYAIWKGKNKSVLSLNLVDFDDSSKIDKLRIVYAWERGDDILRQNGNQYEEDLERYNSFFSDGNTDGL